MTNLNQTTPATTTCYTPDDLKDPLFWIGKEYGITLNNGDTVTPCYSVFIDGEVIKHHGVIDNYPYDIAQHLAKAYPYAKIEAVGYIQTFN